MTHVETKKDYTKNHVFCHMTVQEFKSLHTVCKLERNQILTILAMSVQNPALAGFFHPEIEVTDRCFNRTFIHYKSTVMFVGPFTRQFYDYAIPTPCDIIFKKQWKLILILMNKTFIFSAQNLQNQTLLLCLLLLKKYIIIRLYSFTAQDAGI